MSIHTVSDLVRVVDEDLIARKREIVTARAGVSGRAHASALARRANVCLLYAHWEGFVKHAATAYLEFIASQGLSYADLSIEVIALATRSKIISAEPARRFAMHREVTHFLVEESHARADLPWRTAIATQGNLNWDVFAEIAATVGIDTAQYETKRVAIDEKLLAKRNRIAHGELEPVGDDDYEEIHDLVVDLLELVRTDIQNAAALKAYRRTR